MRARTSFVTLLLVTSLLLAPASLATPSGQAGFGWFSQVKALIVDVFDFFRFDVSEAPADPATLKPQISNVCEEGGPFGDPNGC